jgi:hypothetical protein
MCRTLNIQTNFVFKRELHATLHKRALVAIFFLENEKYDRLRETLTVSIPLWIIVKKFEYPKLVGFRVAFTSFLNTE